MKASFPLLAAVLLLCSAYACSDDSSSSEPSQQDAGQGETDTDSDSADVAEPDVPDAVEPVVVTVLESARLDGLDGGTSQRTRADFDFGQGPFKRVTMMVELETTCYPFDKWLDDLPPEGQNYPPLCDAYDRNFEITVDEPDGDGDQPAFELLRAITPFGGPMSIEVDVTDFANAHPGAHNLQAFIASWPDGAGQVSGSQGGWNVSVSFDVLSGTPPRNVLAAIPLFNNSVGHGNERQSYTFTVPDDAESVRIDYRTTGHGGGEADEACIGHADEFCRRWHDIEIDGLPFRIQPWRDDCDALCSPGTHTWPSGQQISYCAENPTGHPQSVRAPRANWCPGAVTEPIEWSQDSLRTPGEHTLRLRVLDVADGGSWRNSGVVYIYGP